MIGTATPPPPPSHRRTEGLVVPQVTLPPPDCLQGIYHLDSDISDLLVTLWTKRHTHHSRSM